MAILTFEVVSKLNDITPQYDDFTLDEIAVHLEKTKEDDQHGIIRTLTQVLFV